MLFNVHLFTDNCFRQSNITKKTLFYSLFLRKFIRFKYPLIWNTFDRSCYRNSSNYSTENGILPVLIKSENVHSKFLNLLQINTDFLSQMEFLPNKIARASTANIPIDHKIDEILSTRSRINEKMSAQK